MTRITVLEEAATGQTTREFEAKPGTCLLDALLDGGVAVEHACEKAGVCGTCHVYVRSGGESMMPADEVEEDGLDAAWGLDPDSRLSCRVDVGDQDLVIEMPRYSRNLAAERSD